MKNLGTLILQVLAWCVLAAPCGWAMDAKPAEQSFKYTKMYMDDVVKDDGTEDTTYTIGITVLREEALASLKQMDITYSSGAEKVDVLQAYTMKADGRKIDASPNGFQLTVNGGRAGAAPAFSDQTTLTVIFPDVAVGDTVNIVYKRSVTVPLFPRQFSMLYSFPKAYGFDDARISYSIPLALKARYRQVGLHETVRQENNRQLLTWTYKNTQPEKIKYAGTPVARFGDEPGVAVSDFPSYAAIAEAYGVRARPKAAVTPEIQALANDITKGLTSPRDQAKALYDWEVKNITYAGNCISIGSVVPRDLDFVLKNKMGDCKDHATLLQALLGAKGIVSTQALIGVNTYFQLPEIPVVDVINHVINYIPSLDLYVDATSGLPFGVLPTLLAGKPVLLVDGYREGTRTPVGKLQMTQLRVNAKVAISDKGAATGTMSVVMAGVGAFEAQKVFTRLTPQKLTDLADAILKGSGYQGSFMVRPGTWDEKNLTYNYDFDFRLDDYVRIGSPGAIPAALPFGSQHLAASFAQALQAKDDDRAFDFVCSSALIDETYSYVFPPTMKILAVPDNVSAGGAVQTYTSKYSQAGQTVSVSRHLDDRTPGPTCTPAVRDAYVHVAQIAWPDMKAQIVYK